MKIVVFRGAGDYICRPDTTLNHDNSDYYCPEGVGCLSAVPCVYTHIDKAGKCVAERFAGRYFSKVAFGCLLTDTNDDTAGDVATSMDFTSVMDMSWLDPGQKPGYSFSVNSSEICSVSEADFVPQLKAALVDITRRTMLRIGDIIALELGPGTIVKPGDSITMSTDAGSHTIRIY